jgi:proline iminopeptidase
MKRQILSVLTTATVVVACLTGSGACAIHTAPFRDSRGEPIPGSVATMTDATIGGVKQRLWFRAVNATNPPVILVHGGPGASETALFRYFNADLEHRFLMVYWEQRGTGRSYRSDIPSESMTIEQFVRDLDEVVELVRDRFGKERVVLLGHSWGSALGILYTTRHPEKVAAYVGIGQVVDMAEGERLSYGYARTEATRRHHRRALKALDRIGPPPHSVDEMLTSRKWVERFGGAFHGNLSTGKLIWAALRTDEANLVDLIKFGQGNRFSLRHLWPEFREFKVDGTLTSFETPVIFLLGRYDWEVPSLLAARYFQRLHAPDKRLIWFEHSAHNPPFEEPELFNRTLIDVLGPLLSSQSRRVDPETIRSTIGRSETALEATSRHDDLHDGSKSLCYEPTHLVTAIAHGTRSDRIAISHVLLNRAAYAIEARAMSVVRRRR